MNLRETVFGSRSEASVFLSLRARWENRGFSIYPQLPLAALIEATDHLSAKEREFFFMTSVDFTLCLKNGAPLLSIEFDGMCSGYSQYGKYRRPSDEYNIRQKKMDLKLQLASALKYPFVVVSYNETRRLDPDDTLCILDGIIGQILAARDFQRRLSSMDAYSNCDSYELPRYVQEMVLEAESDSELENDPIASKAAEYNCKCIEMGVSGYSETYLSDPPCSPEHVYLTSPPTRVGARVELTLPNGRVLEKIVWVRNVSESYCSPQSISSNAARFLLFRDAYLAMSEQ